ncbi:NTP transferase domain-containing protein [Oceanibaculum indicum]|uniref:Molybdenum cofactor cytidylyltransferase n=1 Tax=Oceanibaculum indicum TaxID=526216 RepID=A0A420WPW1_9PROT|nr:molybdopterin-binding/glycosyltransferase family 2 protein [Oceanibaculum indicum]RKQ73078.1 molybdenum cofactor cytidylyltransferase [Oceanibaculum indicum]
MIFGDTPLDEAEGAILAHSHRLPGKALKKGRVLTAEDIAALRAAGVSQVVAARLEPGDVPEDKAAARLAAVMAGNGTETTAPFTGRCNLIATADGLLTYDPATLDAVNLIDEALTVALLPPYEVVEKGQMIGTVKIIPFAAPEAALEQCESLAGKVSVAAFRPVRAGLVQTALPATKPSVLDNTARITAARLERMGAGLGEELRCAHDTAATAAAIRQQIDAGYDLVLLFGASAVVDRRDVLPAAIVEAGGTVDHFGMPVDPGNLLLLGHIGDTPVIGMPGCARSPKLNGFDWVLQRLVAGLPVTRADIMRMGVGGLLKEIASRPLPREDGHKMNTAPRKAPRIAVLILAAGQSRRMGAQNKLLAQIDGKPMVARVVEIVRASKTGPITIVTGHEADRVKAALPGDIAFVHNPDYAAGLSTSLKAGISALPADIDGVLVCLGDMPRISPAMIDRLIAAFDPVEGREICVPTHKGKRGNPVLWGKRFLPEMAALAGDVGAKHLIGAHADLVVEVEMEEDGVLIDIDTPDALTRYQAS